RYNFHLFGASIAPNSTRGLLMCRTAALLACASYALVLGLAGAHAQTPATPAPKFETEPFSGSELLNGKRSTEIECADLAGAVWVVVDGKGECIRYYHSNAGGTGTDAVFYLGSD